jgi:Family of unknown function (DUF5995)
LKATDRAPKSAILKRMPPASSSRPSRARRHLAAPDLKPIDDVLDKIREIIKWSIDKKSPIGYFAALYLGVTLDVRQAIVDNKFQDGERMVRFDVQFANRYFDAVNAYRGRKAKPPRAWQVALEDHGRPLIVVQQLMMAMNAHIDLDLGVATEEIGRQCKSMDDIHNDFIGVNKILSLRVAVVLKDLEQISPVLHQYRRWLRNADTGFVCAALTEFRNDAWKFACSLAGKPDTDRNDMIRTRDGECALFGRWYVDPVPFSVIIDAIGEDECHDVAHNIEVLSGAAANLTPLPYRLYTPLSQLH